MQGRQPTPDYPITLEPADAKVTVRLGGAVLAQSDNALILREATLPAVYYIPREDVSMDTLTKSATQTHCPYKGDASYFSAGDGAAKDVAWSYEDPFDLVATIKDRLAFYPDRVDSIETSPRA